MFARKDYNYLVVDASEKKLNPEQLKAIQHGEGPLLIIAGAGTGKTTVITERIKYFIIEQKVSPGELLALTFTEKAAREMEERVDVVLPLGYANMWISTFHSFADRILRDEAVNIGLDPNFRVMTQAENIHFLRKNLFEFELEYYRPLGNPNKFIEGLLQHFSRLKDEDVVVTDYFDYLKKLKKEGKEEFEEEIARSEELAKAYQTYEELKTKHGFLDFGDLQSQVLKLFRTRKKILKQYQEQFKYILVDEFQDTNYAQYVLVKLLAPPPKANLTVVGDDNQAIYRFRGAAISNILQFKDDYPGAKEVVLNKNYRSTQTILDVAYRLIKNNDPDSLEAKLGISKKLQKMRQVEEKEVEFLLADRVENEAEIVAKKILELSGDYQYRDFAILVRANNHAEPFVRALNRAGIPNQFLGPGMLFRQPEVKDLIAYLLLLYNLEDSISMYRLLSIDYFGVEGRELATLLNFSRRQKISLFETCEELVTNNSLAVSPKSAEIMDKLVKIIHHHLNLMKTETAGQILYYFLEESGLLKRFSNYESEEDEKKAQNIAKLFDKIKGFEATHEDASVFAVVDFINLSLELGESPLASDEDWLNNNAVNILTVHSAKGLEFPVVFLVNLVAQRFPSLARQEQIPLPQELIKEILPIGDFHLEEERRLFYVGMTRAKDRLYLTAANYYGEGKREKKLSPFVAEALGEKALGQKLVLPQTDQLSIFAPLVKTQKPKSLFPRPALTELSYSQIDSFNTCPLKYKFSYLLSLPTPPSAALTFGSVIHQTMCDFYQRALSGQKPNKKDVLKIMAENWSSLGYISQAHQKKYKKEGEKILSQFFEKAYSAKDLPIVLEQPFSVKISSSLKINGKIDRIDKTKKGIEIIDYKTGKSSSQKEVDKDLQLALYALAATNGTLEYLGVLKETPQPSQVKVSFYFFTNQKKVSTIKKKEDFEKLKKELIRKAEEISQSQFSPTPGKHCDFCEYRMLCEAWS
ncbi:MAG TPA: ATP-dependent DNA helicase [Clostridia bacterium]|nr:ATP-dependent DNA helicase [Clostridia bacterium]